jgi:hypothetical protein
LTLVVVDDAPQPSGPEDGAGATAPPGGQVVPGGGSTGDADVEEPADSGSGVPTGVLIAAGASISGVLLLAVVAYCVVRFRRRKNYVTPMTEAWADKVPGFDDEEEEEAEEEKKAATAAETGAVRKSPFKTAQESFKARYRPTFGTTPDFLLHPYAPEPLSPGTEPPTSPV